MVVANSPLWPPTRPSQAFESGVPCSSRHRGVDTAFQRQTSACVQCDTAQHQQWLRYVCAPPRWLWVGVAVTAAGCWPPAVGSLGHLLRGHSHSSLLCQAGGCLVGSINRRTSSWLLVSVEMLVFKGMHGERNLHMGQYYTWGNIAVRSHIQHLL